MPVRCEARGECEELVEKAAAPLAREEVALQAQISPREHERANPSLAVKRGHKNGYTNRLRCVSAFSAVLMASNLVANR